MVRDGALPDHIAYNSTIHFDLEIGILGKPGSCSRAGMLQLVLIRPHPAIWHLVHGLALFTLLYYIFVISGTWAGMRTIWYFDGKSYEWFGFSRQPNILGKVKRTLG
ncbi:Hypothetical predicted protein [Olea europaea subsp. europaea]|uniref:Uncharacterized protein n=1 Tax=Olea europaea subsp. europaea TaxID=158383 RepID=A0A8S0SJ36_OLEEU|nr:Hypothetical predicted protein [Olea europaea subsp. europaea]